MRYVFGSAWFYVPLLFACGCSEPGAPPAGTPQTGTSGSTPASSPNSDQGFPALQTAGWVGGDSVKLEQLTGNVAVIDCFASW